MKEKNLPVIDDENFRQKQMERFVAGVETVGDYFAGPNHTIPTNGAARYASPLSVRDFQKLSSLIHYSKERLFHEGELIALGVENNIIEKAGAWYSYNGDRIGQGKEKVRVFLKENPDIANDIEQKLRDLLLAKPKAPGDEVVDAQEPVLEEA